LATISNVPMCVCYGNSIYHQIHKLVIARGTFRVQAQCLIATLHVTT
jgi:hypothetical protein